MSKLKLPSHSVVSVQEQIREPQSHAPRILVLYGSLREESYSKKLALEAANILSSFGAEVRVFDPSELPIYGSVDKEHSKVKELTELAIWSEGMVWCSPEIHGNMSSVFKNQIDWIPLSVGAIRPTQGRTLAVMQVCGGSQSFNVVNNLRTLGRWMRMFTIPNQSSVPMAWQEFNEDGSMKESNYKKRVVDVMEELFRMTIILRDNQEWLTHRYSENVEEYQDALVTKIVEEVLE
ncbi:arsenical resistance protein ArsH [Psychrobium sp. 1_MG-2023]|uniref:arsenical resistance protein ArsH n=1 Tax=Psychrobium sp. 1_MG-2023 TaxID=3062624 RepID=UPI000C3244DC|nr:arsenical resistance protein ArsH [Psychrobium sp. 1_MG-2023]MDP2562932.1 arsenical resistance protein ArsH [Psychrobium sp. 1_MG-2023]PKF54700.1 arsenical resistance protein ArsH [Alteromonadales bacterium alter-6D02]